MNGRLRVVNRGDAARAIVAGVFALTTACAAPDATPYRNNAAGDGMTISEGRLPVPADWPSRYALGRPASAADIALMDTDVDTTGAGLPAGHGTAAEGARLYTEQCASCHGAHGEGIAPAPAVIKPIALNDSFPWATKAGVPKTLGNYWPFATTMFAYIRHSMPLATPGSLSPAEVYQVMAYLLAENGLMAREAVLDAHSLAAIKLPMRKRFVLDNRPGSADFR